MRATLILLMILMAIIAIRNEVVNTPTTEEKKEMYRIDGMSYMEALAMEEVDESANSN